MASTEALEKMARHEFGVIETEFLLTGLNFMIAVVS